MKNVLTVGALALVCLSTSGCLGAGLGLGSGSTGLDPKFMDGVNSILTSSNCGHHDEFRATVGAAGIPASTTVVLVRDCPTPTGVPAGPSPAATAAAAVGVAPQSFDTAPAPKP